MSPPHAAAAALTPNAPRLPRCNGTAAPPHPLRQRPRRCTQTDLSARLRYCPNSGAGNDNLPPAVPWPFATGRPADEYAAFPLCQARCIALPGSLYRGLLAVSRPSILASLLSRLAVSRPLGCVTRSSNALHLVYRGLTPPHSSATMCRAARLPPRALPAIPPRALPLR